MIRDYFNFAFSSFKHRKTRSYLTMIGIFIGIAAVVALISVGQGMQTSIESEFEKMGTNLITIMPGGGMAGMGGLGGSADKLTETDVKLVKSVRGIEGVSAMIFRLAQVEYNDKFKYTYVVGLDTEKESLDVITSMSQFQIDQGRMIESKDKYSAAVGWILANEDDMFGKKMNSRSKIIIEDKEFKIVGNLEEIGSRMDDTQIYIPLETAEEIFDSENEYDFIYIRTVEGMDTSEIAEAIEKELRNDRGEEKGEETFSVSTAEDLMQSFGAILGIVQAVFIGIAAISLLVGGIGIMNTMYTAVLERTREIGIMKAVGARNSDILALFLIESGILGLTGGVIGVVLGIGLGKSVEIMAAAGGFGILKASMSPTIIIGALLFSFVIGSLSGVLPARQAAKLKPVDALRYE